MTKYVARINVNYPNSENLVSLHVSDSRSLLVKTLENYAQANFPNRWCWDGFTDKWLDLKKSDSGYSSYNRLGIITEYIPTEQEKLQEEISSLENQLKEKKDRLVTISKGSNN